jgi:uncharacterized protein YndB with AHSA1/START domain
MTRKRFSSTIRAPRETVWNVLWEDQTYRKWTNVFSEGSYAVSDWKEGSKVQFLSQDGGGLFSTIDKLVPNEVMQFRHQGEIRNGQELPPNDASSNWYGAMEIYNLADKGGETELTVEVDITEEHQEYFNQVFPKALDKVKELAESKPDQALI